MLSAMFVVSEEAAAAIRATLEQEGEASAAIEPAVSRDHRQRQGEGVRPDHRRLEAASRCGLSDLPLAPS